jgi:hypothetical protein
MRSINLKRDVLNQWGSLAGYLSAGLALGAGLYYVTHSLSVLVIFPLASLATWASFIPERRFHRQYAARPRLDDDQFFQAYYAESDVSLDIVRRLRPIYAGFFELDPTQLHPLDRPPELIELDTADLLESIEKEFRVSMNDSDAEQLDGSFDSIARYLARHAN